MNNEFKYTFDEGNILNDVLEYIRSTYGEHYAGSDDAVQFTEYFARQNLDKSEAIGAFRFNAGKYLARYGKKAGYSQKDLFKAIHYIVMMLYVTKKYNLNGDDKNTDV